MPNEPSMELVGAEKLQRNLSYLEREAFPRAMSRALNRTAKTVRARNARSIAEAMGSKISGVKRRFKIRRSNSNNLEARLRISGRRLNLEEFKARQVKRGVSAAPWGRRRIFPGTFMVRLGGTKLVFKRAKVGRSRVGRLPIEPVYGPGHASTAAKDEMEQEREEIVDERLPVELESALEYLTSRMGR